MTTRAKTSTEVPAELPAATLASMFFRSFLLQAAWNFERMQNFGFLFALKPALMEVWTESGDRVAALHRHVEFFNTNPYLAGYALGAAAKLEQEMAAAPKAERQAREARLRSFKSVLASTCAAIGDPFFWGVLRPFCTLLTLAVWGLGAFWFWYGQTLRGEDFTALPAVVFAAGLAVYLVAFNVPALALRATGVVHGYEKGEAVAPELKRLPLRNWEKGLRWAGFLLAAAGGVAFLTVAAARGEFWILAGALAVFALKVWDFSTPALYACTLSVCLAAALIAP